MSDVIDTANETAEINIQSAIANRPKATPLPVTGACHNCGENTELTFCDVDCRDDYERLQNARTRNGRI